MGPLLGALSFIAFAICLIALAFPFKKLPYLRTRKEASIGLGVSFALFIVALIITPTPEEGSAPAAAGGEASSSAVDETKPATKPEGISPEQKVEASRAFMEALKDSAGTCDMYGARIADSVEAGDLVALYEASDAGERSCYAAATKMSDVEPPAFLSKEGRKSLKASAGKLADAYRTKGYGMSRFKKIADGDMRASMISEAKQSAEGSQAMAMIAFAEIFASLSEEGVDTEKVMAD